MYALENEIKNNNSALRSFDHSDKNIEISNSNIHFFSSQNYLHCGNKKVVFTKNGFRRKNL